MLPSVDMAGAARSRTGRTARSGPRRAPRPEDRQRDAQRTRQRILQAAVEEFSAKGFAGARVAEIAKRADVNAQLITYYFDGKQGLYDALRESWASSESTFATPDQPFSAVVRAYLDAVLDRPDLSRLLVWQALDGPSEDAERAQAEQVRHTVEDIQRRQRSGELTADFDAEVILVVLWAAAMAPVTIPHVIRGAFSNDLATPTARASYASQLERLFANPTPTTAGGRQRTPKR